MNQYLPSAITALPLLAAAALTLGRSRVILICACFCTLVLGTMQAVYAAGGSIVYTSFYGLNIFHADFPGAFFVLISASLFLAGACFVKDYATFPLYLIFLSSVMGMEMSASLFTFWAFMALASVSSAGILMRTSGKHAFGYLTAASATGAFFLLASAFLYGRYGTTDIATLARNLIMGNPEKICLALICCCLMSMCCAAPLHRTYGYAMGRGGTCLAFSYMGLFMAAIYALVRVCYTVYGDGITETPIPWAMAGVGVFSIAAGTCAGLIEKRIPRFVVWQWITQVGYVILSLAVGMFCLKDAASMAEYGYIAVQGAMYQVAATAAAMALLAWYAAFCGRRYRWLLAAAGACAAGIPPFCGFTARFFIYESLFAVHPALGAFAAVASVACIVSFMRFYRITSRREPTITACPQAAVAGILLFAAILSAVPATVMSGVIDPISQFVVNRGAYIIDASREE